MAALAVSLLTGVGFLWGAVVHEAAAAAGEPAAGLAARKSATGHEGNDVPSEPGRALAHRALEAALWGGFLVCGLVFASGFFLFHGEVRAEKQRRRRVADRRSLLRAVRDYQLGGLGGNRANN